MADAPAEPVIGGFDLGPNLTGYCVGSADRMPFANAWRMTADPEDLGGLGLQLWRYLDALHRNHRMTVALYESPILKPHDKLETLRRLYGIGAVFETWCATAGIPCYEASVSELKRTLAGHHLATKDDMVAAAEKLGITLPKTLVAGRRDAADAVGAWYIGVMHYARHQLPRWDKVLYSARGALL